MIRADSHFQWPWMGKWTLPCISSGEAAGEESRRSRGELPTPIRPCQQAPPPKAHVEEEDSRLQMLGPHLLSESPSSPGARGQGWWAASKVVLPGFPEEATPFPAMILRTILWDGCFQGHSNTLSSSMSFSSVPPKSLPLLSVLSQPQNLKAVTLSEKARNTAVCPIPCGGVPALPPGSRCKGTAVEVAGSPVGS